MINIYINWLYGVQKLNHKVIHRIQKKGDVIFVILQGPVANGFIGCKMSRIGVDTFPFSLNIALNVDVFPLDLLICALTNPLATGPNLIEQGIHL